MVNFGNCNLLAIYLAAIHELECFLGIFRLLELDKRGATAQMRMMSVSWKVNISDWAVGFEYLNKVVFVDILGESVDVNTVCWRWRAASVAPGRVRGSRRARG